MKVLKGSLIILISFFILALNNGSDGGKEKATSETTEPKGSTSAETVQAGSKKTKSENPAEALPKKKLDQKCHYPLIQNLEKDMK